LKEHPTQDEQKPEHCQNQHRNGGGMAILVSSSDRLG
jgi:hypothetical protein